MPGPRRRGKQSASSPSSSVIILSSSDDEEANRDLSIEIVEKSKNREAKRKRGKDKYNPRLIDLDSISSDDGPPTQLETPSESAPEAKKPKKRKKKKKSAVDETATVVEEVPEALMQEEAGPGDSVVTTEVPAEAPAEDNAILRKLLRIPRYFDAPGDRIVDSCYNCGEEGHRAAECGMERRKRPCFVCGMFGHVAKLCTQGQDCYICKKRGHAAKNCPDKDKLKSHDSKICLRCGDIGHEMSSCKNSYTHDDLKEIQCYICKKYGHLCCVNLTFPAPEEVSCYRCARFGHVGVGCTKKMKNVESSVLASPSSCYKCGEAGHLARGCRSLKVMRSAPSKDDSFIRKRFPKRKTDTQGHKSAPHNIGREHRKKNVQHENGWNVTPQKSRIRGGWTVDDSGDQSDLGNRSNNWRSPKTPVWKSPQNYHVNSSKASSSSQSPWNQHKYFSGTPSTNGSTIGYNYSSHASLSAYQRDFYDSRYNNSQGRRHWRN